MQKYYLLINQSCIILLGIATIFAVTEYQDWAFWKTDNGSQIIEAEQY